MIFEDATSTTWPQDIPTVQWLSWCQKIETAGCQLQLTPAASVMTELTLTLTLLQCYTYQLVPAWPLSSTHLHFMTYEDKM